MTVTLRFLGWARPVAEAAAEALLPDAAGPGLDLRDTLVMVPTAHSGRRLRERLARLAASRGGGAAFPGPVVTPGTLLDAGAGIASPPAVWMAWSKELMALRDGALGSLLPHGPPRDFPSALALARRLAGVCDALGEAGLDPLDVAERFDGLGEPARWGDLARLHSACLSRLAAAGLRDRNRGRREAAEAPEIPPEIRRVVVLAVPDPLSISLRGLEVLARRLPVEILVHAPPELADAFDGWGRPRADAWDHMPLPLDDGDLAVAGTPAEQAAAAGRFLDELDVPLEDLVIGMPEPSLAPTLRQEMERRGARGWDPGGQPLAVQGLARLAAACTGLGRRGEAEDFARLLRHPEVLRTLEASGTDSAAALEAVDTLRVDHLPATFEDLLRAARRDGGPALLAAAALGAEIRDRLAAGPLPGALRGLLGSLLCGRSLEGPGGGPDAAAAEALAALLADLEAPGVGIAELALPDAVSLFMAGLEGRMVRPPERPGDAVDLVGWLELPWEDARVLVLTGMNEGRVPEARRGDPFLPDAARVVLGLPSNRDRFARDAALLHGMCAWRRARGGRVCVVAGRTDAAGEPLRPSRLLFLCGDDELPGRTRRLFSPPPEAGPPAPRSWPAPLRPRVLPPPDHLRVTSFRDYLACPFRFYLRHVLRMGAVDDRKAELDALDFGTLCHQALEAMGREEELRDCTSGERLAAFLEDRAQRWMRERFGARLSAPLRVQLDAARQRLAWAARVQARERAEGWRIEAVEHAVGGSAGATLAGVPVRGTADRIDRHLGSGRVRVLDYKTSETIRAPAQVHLGSPRAGDPPWTEAPSTKGPKRWADLQLPLYVLLLQEELGAGISAGYFHLPRAVRDTAVTAWEELDDSLLDSARTCAEGVVDAIRAGIFWPPGPPPRHDDFAELLLDAPELTVDGAWMSGMARPREEQP